MIKKLICLISMWFLCSSSNLKILNLIIASDQYPIYLEFQSTWRSYMHLYPGIIESYFLKCNPKLKTVCEIDKDIIWSKFHDGWPPQSASIINKTLVALEKLYNKLDEFDYILRTNLSSFYIFPRFLEFLENLPKNKCYCGSQINPREKIGSGSGFIISKDVAKLLVKNKYEMLDKKNMYDDELIGHFLNKKGIHLITHERINIENYDTWLKTKDNIPQDLFQFRIKTGSPKWRLQHDLEIHKFLLKTFYNL